MTDAPCPHPPPDPADRIAWADPGDWPVLSGCAFWLDRFYVRQVGGTLRCHSNTRTALAHACSVASILKRRAHIAATAEYARRIVMSG